MNVTAQAAAPTVTPTPVQRAAKRQARSISMRDPAAPSSNINVFGPPRQATTLPNAVQKDNDVTLFTNATTYLEKPRIVNDKDDGPIITPLGNRFYLQRGGSSSIQLRCQASGYPNPTQFTWFMDGASIGRGQSFPVGQQLLGQSIYCTVGGANFQSRSSSTVKIAPWDIPAVVQSNLGQSAIQSSNPNSFSGGKIQIGKRVKMSCTATGNPLPIIFWRVQNSTSTIPGNASCTTTQVLLARPGQACTNTGRTGACPTVRPGTRLPITVYYVQSECSLVVNDYSLTGNYWCSACNKVSATLQHCRPSVDHPATPSVNIQVNGPPRQSALPFAVQEGNEAIISAYYCADPAPQARQIYWTINDQRLNIGETLDNYQAESPQSNGTACYTARLNIRPVTETDVASHFILHVQNTFGTQPIPVNVKALLAVGLLVMPSSPTTPNPPALIGST